MIDADGSLYLRLSIARETVRMGVAHTSGRRCRGKNALMTLHAVRCTSSCVSSLFTTMRMKRPAGRETGRQSAIALADGQPWLMLTLHGR